MDQYYLTDTEIALLERYADRIAERIPHGAMVVELVRTFSPLGSGWVQWADWLLQLSKYTVYTELSAD